MAASAPLGIITTSLSAAIEPLTGLARGGAFEAEVQRLVALAPERPLAVLVLDLDRFGHVNDLLGYGQGDEVLRAVGQRLAQWPGQGVVVARLGGDEFAVVVPGCDASGVEAQSAIAAAMFQSAFEVAGRALHLTVSCGVSLYPGDGTGAQELIRAAMVALERAKHRGGNQWEPASAEAGSSPEKRHTLESALRGALANQELSLRFQPQVDRDGRMQGLEALLVWQNPVLGRVEPEAFVRMAEEIGVIFPIGAWVLRESLRQVAEWRKRMENPPRVAVNVSALQFNRPDFAAVVRAALVEFEVPGHFLELEITESAILDDLDACALRMAQLRALGVRIAIDDFGVGYSPLAYLHKLPLDVVKVDKGFVREITSPGGTLPVVHTITVLAHHRGLQVVAEGVETLEQLELVRAARCDLVQGYLVSNPLEAAGVAALLDEPERLGACFRGERLHY